MMKLPSLIHATTTSLFFFTFFTPPTLAKHHHHDHYVCAIGYHYIGDGVCRQNGDWYRGRRYQPGYGYEYRPQPSGSIDLFNGAVKLNF